MNYRIKNKVGFTLVELSIVLVIIGLVIGGVMVGRDLIEASKIRAQITQISDIETQINTFRVKYNCLPGDCINATSAIGSTYNGNTINDGDGDGLIRSIYAYGIVQTVGDCLQPDATGEVSQLLLQLRAAGFGNYLANGVLNSGNAVVGINYSYAAYGNRTGFFISCLTRTTNAAWIPLFLRRGNIIVIGAGAATIGRIGYGIGTYGKYSWGTYGYYAAGTTINPIGIPADAVRQIDEKTDDGIPNSGKFGIISGESLCDDSVTSYPSPNISCRVTAGKKIN